MFWIGFSIGIWATIAVYLLGEIISRNVRKVTTTSTRDMERETLFCRGYQHFIDTIEIPDGHVMIVGVDENNNPKISFERIG